MSHHHISRDLGIRECYGSKINALWAMLPWRHGEVVIVSAWGPEDPGSNPASFRENVAILLCTYKYAMTQLAMFVCWKGKERKALRQKIFKSNILTGPP
jgi:hypothetical protein